MTTRLKWLVWGGFLIAYDLLIGIPGRVAMSLVLIGALWVISDLYKRLETLGQSTRLDDLTKRVEELNKRLRWASTTLSEESQ